MATLVDAYAMVSHSFGAESALRANSLLLTYRDGDDTFRPVRAARWQDVLIYPASGRNAPGAAFVAITLYGAASSRLAAMTPSVTRS
jgi:hypothetical protein